MFTSRFLNLLHGRLALTKRDVWALALARRWNKNQKTVTDPQMPAGEEVLAEADEIRRTGGRRKEGRKEEERWGVIKTKK